MKHNFTHSRLAGPLAVAATGTLALAASSFAASGDDDVTAASFDAPVRLMAAGAPISMEAPGYACPTWHDVNGDGRHDLVVGQFADGKLQYFVQNEDRSFQKGEWIQAGGEVAKVPGVW